MKTFESARLRMESRNDLQAGSTETVQLLKPSCHLTEACWKSFRKHVCGIEGWAAKRRVASEEEKKRHGETRKGKVYFVDVIYTVPRKVRTVNTLENYIQVNWENYEEDVNENDRRGYDDGTGAGPYNMYYSNKRLKTYSSPGVQW